jgi:23S rRNA pseudouridine1911/1915/1917 synthase
MKRQISLPPETVGQRLDLALTAATGLSRSQLQRQLKQGLVCVNGAVAGAKYAVVGGEAVTIEEVAPAAVPAVPHLPILYEDDDVLVVDKPAGLIVHTSESGRSEPTVAAFAHAQGVQDEDSVRPGIVHRLDKDTSGAMVIAKNPKAKAELQRQFRARSVRKTYTALVRGHLQEAEAIMNLPIGRNRKRPVERAVIPGGRPAVTHYRVISTYPGASLVEVDLQTGRTHQIRVHFSHIGHPIIGDRLYGSKGAVPELPRQFLHAASLAFQSPSGRAVRVTSPLPPDLRHYLASLDGGV